MSNFKSIFKKDYYRNTNGKCYHWYSYFGMKYTCKVLYWYRKAQLCRGLSKKIARYVFNKKKNKHNNEFSWRFISGPGLFLGHKGPRYINENVVIGINCNINQMVTIGEELRGDRKGVPTIGNDVWFGAGSVVVGKITIGNNVLIAPNAYVNFDIPDNSIIIGNPGKIIYKENATEDYINYKI